LLAEHGKQKEVLDFLGTTENISVLSTLFPSYIQNTTATGRKINSIPAETRTLGFSHSCLAGSGIPMKVDTADTITGFSVKAEFRLQECQVNILLTWCCNMPNLVVQKTV